MKLEKNDFVSILKLGLILTLIFGILLRIQFSGIEILDLSFDWYRVHTHIGYYLFLIPSVLWPFKSDISRIHRLYFLIAGFALVLFFLQGYSIASKIFSGILYFFWIYQSFQIKFERNKWLWVPKAGFLVSLFFLILVVLLPKFSADWDSAQLAKGFLLSIFVSVILPSVLGHKFIIDN